MASRIDSSICRPPANVPAAEPAKATSKGFWPQLFDHLLEIFSIFGYCFTGSFAAFFIISFFPARLDRLEEDVPYFVVQVYLGSIVSVFLLAKGLQDDRCHWMTKRIGQLFFAFNVVVGAIVASSLVVVFMIVVSLCSHSR